MTMAVTQHALDRYRLHHPESDTKDVELALSLGQRVPSDLAMVVLGRHRTTCDTYIVPSDCRGLFVVVDGRTVVTYLRFQATQKNFMMKHFPRAEVKPPAVEVKPPAAKVKPPPKPSWWRRGPLVAPEVEQLFGAKSLVLAQLRFARQVACSMDEDWNQILLMCLEESGAWLHVVVPWDPYTRAKVELAPPRGPHAKRPAETLIDPHIESAKEAA